MVNYQDLLSKLCSQINVIDKDAKMTFDAFKRGKTYGVNLVYKDNVILKETCESDLESSSKIENELFGSLIIKLMLSGVKNLISNG